MKNYLSTLIPFNLSTDKLKKSIVRIPIYFHDYDLSKFHLNSNLKILNKLEKENVFKGETSISINNRIEIGKNLYLSYAYSNSFENKFSENTFLKPTIFENRFQKYNDSAKDIFFESHYLNRINLDPKVDIDKTISTFNPLLFNGLNYLKENNVNLIHNFDSGVFSFSNSYLNIYDEENYYPAMEKILRSFYWEKIKDSYISKLNNYLVKNLIQSNLNYLKLLTDKLLQFKIIELKRNFSMFSYLKLNLSLNLSSLNIEKTIYFTILEFILSKTKKINFNLQLLLLLLYYLFFKTNNKNSSHTISKMSFPIIMKKIIGKDILLWKDEKYATSSAFEEKVDLEISKMKDILIPQKYVFKPKGNIKFNTSSYNKYFYKWIMKRKIFTYGLFNSSFISKKLNNKFSIFKKILDLNKDKTKNIYNKYNKTNFIWKKNLNKMFLNLKYLKYFIFLRIKNLFIFGKIKKNFFLKLSKHIFFNFIRSNFKFFFKSLKLNYKIKKNLYLENLNYSLINNLNFLNINFEMYQKKRFFFKSLRHFFLEGITTRNKWY